jgi:hypothetical protein
MTATKPGTQPPKAAVISEMIDSFEFYLREPIRYSFAGEFPSTNRIEIHAPSVGVLIKKVKLDQMVTQAVVRASTLFTALRQADSQDTILLEDKKPEEEEDNSPRAAGETARSLIVMSDLDVEVAINHFGVMAMEGCVRVERMNLNLLQWRDIREDDKLDMFYQFVGVFMLPSTLQAEKEVAAERA